jgi:ABC-type antimicrobial peptide transport system permease subunit
MAGIGLVLGLLLAIGATRLETSMLFGVSPLDALSLTVAIAVLAVAITLAAWLPARRAASIDPMQALRTE